MSANVYAGIESNKNIQPVNGDLMSAKPLVDIIETENAIRLFIDMPNVSRESLRVSAENGFLIITGKKVSANQNGHYLLREIPNVKYERIFELTHNLDTENIKANYHSGVLTVTIEKKELLRSRKIDIQ